MTSPREEDAVRVACSARTIEGLLRARADWVDLLEHELRTPICVILGHAELMAEREDVRSDPTLLRQVEALIRNAERLAAIVERGVLLY